MRRILLTGANGQLGRALRKVYGSEVEFIATEMVESEGISVLDLADLSAVEACIRDGRPDVVINCAAMTNVDGCETNWEGALRANAIGPRNLAIACEEAGAKLIHVSTDYVFDGREREKPYTEMDTPSPVSAYGRSKLYGEEFVKTFSSHFFIFRTAWLYGDGHNFVKTMLSLAAKRDELAVVCDQRGTPTSAMELARTIHCMEPTKEYGVYHATCEGDTNWAVFAERIFEKAGKKVAVRHVTSEEYKEINPASADRPKYGILDNQMLRLVSDHRMADWEDALDEYLREIFG